jgi:hypothetical protein
MIRKGVVTKKRTFSQDREASRPHMHVIVELPPGSVTKTVRKFKIPESITAGEMVKLLAKHFKVEQDNWRLYGRANETPSHILDKTDQLGKYSSDKGKGRLYFYPEFRL